MLHSFLTSGGRPQTTLTNIVPNNNFANTTGWEATAATLAADSNILSVTGNGTNALLYTNDANIGIRVLGMTYYGRVKARVTNSSCTKLRLVVAGGGIYDINSPAANQWYDMSVNRAATGSGNSVISVQAYYADAATANGKVAQVQESIVLDLTARFGSGVEPTAAQVKRWLDIFSASWFVSTKLIPKRIY